MTKIYRACDLCGDRAQQIRLRAAHDIPLAILTRGIRRELLESEGRPFVFELTDETDGAILGVPFLCARCFQEECNRVSASNKEAAFGELVASLRRKN